MTIRRQWSHDNHTEFWKALSFLAHITELAFSSASTLKSVFEKLHCLLSENTLSVKEGLTKKSYEVKDSFKNASVWNYTISLLINHLTEG